MTAAPIESPAEVIARLLAHFSGARSELPDEWSNGGGADTTSQAGMVAVRAEAADAMLPLPALAPHHTSRRVPRTAVDQRVVLHPHQRDAVLSLRALLRRHGGALLADEPGTGKTFTALEVARPHRSPLVVAPAVLLPMWREASLRARVQVALVSYERLSACRTPPDGRPDLLVLDEAHHLRNPATRRFRAVAQMAWGIPVLLLSATPIHNRRAELTALFSLFLGSGAHGLADDELARLVVRRRAEHLGPWARLPALRTLQWESIPPSPDVLAALLALPPPVPPADGGRADALLRLSLLRAWCSSDAALLEALRQRLASSAALEHALSHGRHPSRRELVSWSGTGDSIQLGFAELLAGRAPTGAPALLECVQAHAAAVRALRARLARELGRDPVRFARLREVVRSHEGVPAIVFTYARATARAAYRALAASTRCALVSGQSALIASGSISRAELLARFSSESVATGTSRHPPDADIMRIDVLVSTDVLSEGVNLPAAGLVVHLDLPWTPARLEQRVGRVRRLGSRWCEVVQVAIAPPADAAELRDVVRHLAEKGGVARRLVGDALPPGGMLVPPVAGDGGDEGAADAAESLRRLCGELARRDAMAHIAASTADCGARTPVAYLCARAGQCGALALVEHGDELEAVSLRDAAPAPSMPSADPRHALQLLRQCDIPSGGGERSSWAAHAPPAAPSRIARAPSASETVRASWARQAHERLAAWCLARDAEELALSDVTTRSRAHGAILRRVSASAARGGRLGRARRAALGAAARSAVLGTAGVGGEGVLERLLREAPTDGAPGARDAEQQEPPGDDAERRWLGDIVSRLAERARPPVPARGRRRVAALLLVVPDDP